MAIKWNWIQITREKNFFFSVGYLSFIYVYVSGSESPGPPLRQQQILSAAEPSFHPEVPE